MHTPEQTERWFIDVVDRLLEAGWLDHRPFSKGRGTELAWTPEGGARARALKNLVDTFSLCDHDLAPLAFDLLAKGEGPDVVPTTMQIEPIIARFWCECIAQLDLHGDRHRLVILVCTISAWAPVQEGKTQFSRS